MIEDGSTTAPTKAHKKADIEFSVEKNPRELDVVIPVTHLAKTRGFRWGSILASALLTLFSIWASFTIVHMIEAFFASSLLLGWLSLAVAGVAAFAAAAIVIREIWGMFRLRRIEKLQHMAARALNLDDADAASETVNDLTALYQGKPDAAWNLKNYQTHAADILDPQDRVRLLERYLVDPLDETAHQIIARRARRVTLLTTVTPAAALDVLFVAAQNVAMLREIATLYGGRPSTFATLKLARMVVAHLAVAGGLALSDNLIHLFVGKGILGRLSARFGEGAVNGILTSRIGLAACDVCRPIPKASTRRETLGSMLKELATFGERSKVK